VTEIGLLSDTHVPHRMPVLPPAVFERLAGVDLILHAGDLDDPAILDELRRIAPVRAVRGNWHFLSPWPNDQSLPLTLDFEVEGRRFVVTHGHLSFWRNIWDKHWLLMPNHRARTNVRLVKRLSRVYPGADVYVFGHCHRALVEQRGGALFVNPGAVCPTRGEVASVARMRVTRDGVEVEILPL
jgi:putative phosphoesterase